MIGYPTHSLSTLQPLVGYPSALLKRYKATVKPNCARILAACGRLITFASGLGIRSGQMHNEARYLMRGKKFLRQKIGSCLGSPMSV